MKQVLRKLALPGNGQVGHLERWLSVFGGLVGLTGVIIISQLHLGMADHVGLVASMGASAVLLFAVPHGPLSQPWPVLGGHIVSALIGVACAKMLPGQLIAAPVAVGLAIGAMHYLRCIHPPGGATALSAVIGGETVQQLGFAYVIEPVLYNTLVILGIAVLFNLPFHWRRYPLVLARGADTETEGER